MDPITMIMLGATISGAATSTFGSFSKSGHQKELLKAQLQEEQLRRTQMEYDAQRSQRQLIRNAQTAASVQRSNAEASGANYGSASGGAKGQIQGQYGEMSNQIAQNLKIGEGIFDLNEKEARLKSKIGLDQDVVGLGSTISGMGGSMGRMFGSVGGRPLASPSSDATDPMGFA